MNRAAYAWKRAASLVRPPRDRSLAVSDPAVIERFSADPDHVFVVSFPRTGSHWLRMLSELYFGRPSLARIFYFPENDDYLAYHSHDLDLTVERRDVIYLYRDPVNTIFSQMTYEGDALTDEERIAHWSDLYGRHLHKWLVAETFTRKKTILTYEGMNADLGREFGKYAAHFGKSLNRLKLRLASRGVRKDRLQHMIEPEFSRAIRFGPDYEAARYGFRRDSASAVWRHVLAGRDALRPHFDHLKGPPP